MWKRSLFFLVVLGASISLIRSTMGQGTDFLVYWKTAGALLEGKSIYDLNQFGGMIFKYPPWLAPLFLPLSYLPFEWAKFFWGLFQWGSLLSVFYILRKHAKIKVDLIFWVALLYWGIWAVHFLDGQIAIPLMALALISVTRNSSSMDALSAYALSSKLFTVFPLWLVWKRYLKKTTLLWLGLMLWFGSAAVMMKTEKSFPALISDWRVAASSGAKYLPEGNTRGKKNPSLSNYTAGLLQVPATDSQAESLIALGYFLLAAAFLIGFTRHLDELTRFSIALALTPVAHPLPWLHLFSWTFPLMVLTVQQLVNKNEPLSLSRLSQGRWLCAGLAVGLAIVMVPLGTHEVFGRVGVWLELHAAKSFGTLLLVFARMLLAVGEVAC